MEIKLKLAAKPDIVTNIYQKYKLRVIESVKNTIFYYSSVDKLVH